MKTSCYLCNAGCCAPLILAAPANATFTGLSTESWTNAFGIDVVSVFANFDQPGDQLTAIAGTPMSPLNLSVIGGTFFQHALGGDRAPVDAGVAMFPSLAFDTFVTIGESSLASLSASWLVLPMSPQADPFNPAFVAGVTAGCWRCLASPASGAAGGDADVARLCSMTGPAVEILRQSGSSRPSCPRSPGKELDGVTPMLGSHAGIAGASHRGHSIRRRTGQSRNSPNHRFRIYARRRHNPRRYFLRWASSGLSRCPPSTRTCSSHPR